MKSGKVIALAAVLLAASAAAIRAELESWVQHIPSGAAITALFRNVPMPGGAVPILRPPSETRPALTNLIVTSPRDADLYRLRAQGDEMALDFTAAETDWKTYAQMSADRYTAELKLADFYHRRMRSRDELATLRAATSVKDDPLLPATSQRSWRAFERMAALIREEALPRTAAEPVFRTWVGRYPKERAAWRNLIGYLTESGDFTAAETEIAAYGRAFADELDPVRMRAELALRRGSADEALRIYDQAFQPLWPDDMRVSYFKLLEQEGQLREFAGRARTALASNPTDLNATARLFHYFRSQNNIPAARRVLLEYRIAKESSRQPWTADELETAAQLFEWLPDVNEAARLYYALYSVPPAARQSGDSQAERALYGLANLLVTAPDQPIQFGSGDLSFYKDIATIDSSPGFLNGILSLLLNSTGPRWEYEKQNEKSLAYFHRAAATQLVALIEQRFPQSQYRAPLRASLVTAYGAYGDDTSVIRAGREYLSAFPNGAARVPVAMQVADALARQNRTTEEFALYDQMLRELGRKAASVPIGAEVTAVEATPPPAGLAQLRNRFPQSFGVAQNVVTSTPFNHPQENPSSVGARSPEYVQILDKYLSRLATLNRPLDALRVYRAEIDRNPNDPGLYQRFGAFLEQNGMARDVEDTYTKAIAKFGDRSWYDKLARWYLRRKESAALEKISREAIAAFSGTELERYFAEIVSQTHPEAALYRQLNLYAHDRFPEDLVFVRNLLNAYSRRETYDARAYESLLRQYWFYDSQLRTILLRSLSAQGRLTSELAEIRAANPGLANGQYDQALAANPAAVQFFIEGEVWLSHFELAAPAARSLANAYPGRREFAEKASSLYRSLAPFDKRDTEIAVTLASFEQRADPRDQTVLARMGDIYADRELFGRARVLWERMPATQPGKPDSYLDAATVYWDYYRYDDALRWIANARKKFEKPALFTFEAGAIYEGKRDDASAVREYVAGALHGESAAERRLLRLLNRPEIRGSIDSATAASVASDPTRQAVSLRISVLEAENHRPEIESLLQARVEAEKSSTELTELQETARRLGFDTIEARASERLAAITNDPVDKMRLTLAYARLLESKKDVAGAARVVDALYHDHPLILGVLRGAVDFHVRNHQPAEAIDILLDASQHARTDLAAQFTLEAARRATRADAFHRARSLLSGLLLADPLRAEYLAAMADTYLAAKDDRGFRDYELATIQRLKQSALTPAERIERVAAIRRSLIPALDRLHDPAGATDQYLELVDSYPEDEALTKEAASYAVAHQQSDRLAAFYRKTIGDAPRDYRWPIVLARIETVTEDFPSAIADYERAIQDRPDRADVLEAKARLEERLMRFDDAIKSYSRLYELAYRDPQWLIKVAELDARTSRQSEAVTTLKTAIIGARTETADADFAIAERLESWHILPDAVAFAEHGANLAGAELFSKQPGNAVIYARIMTRTRRMNEVLPRMTHEGVSQAVASAAGSVIAQIYTPEEKAQLEQSLTSQASRMTVQARSATLLPLAASAGLVELESRWRLESITAQHARIDNQFVTLQSERGVYAQVGRQLEEYAANNPGQPVEPSALAQSIQAFIAEGDVNSQMRVMRQALARNGLSGVLLDRYFALLAARQPDELLAIIRANPSADIRNRAVQFAIAGDDSSLAYSAVQTRGSALPAVWAKAYTALAGEYFNDRAPAVDAAFQSALDTRIIGERLQTPLKPDSVIVGSVWFYYGARYGDYLATGKSPTADKWLPASLEAAPGDPSAYVALGDSYSEYGQGSKAVTQFEHALELDPDRGDAHDHIARILWDRGRRPEAVAQWKSALAAFLRIQSRGVRVPETFWGRVAESFTDIGQRRALPELRGDIANLLGDYYQRNGVYRLDELIRAAASACIASGEETDWLIALGQSVDEQATILDSVMRLPGLTDPQRISFQRQRVALDDQRVQSSFGDSREYAATQAVTARLQLISMLLAVGDVTAASAEWAQIASQAAGRFQTNERVEVELRLASRNGALDSVLTRYRDRPDLAPSADALRNAALVLQRDHDEDGARSVFEFLYDREIRSGHLDAPNFLGLAEVNLERNQTAGAVALLNRMALVVDDGFETLMPAAELLSRFGRTTEATDFIRKRVQAVPWDGDAQFQLARSLPAGSPERDRLLAMVVDDSQARYSTRAQAARFAGSAGVSIAANTELALLSSGAIAPQAASKPYQVEARIEAARSSRDAAVQLRMWREALALAPTDQRIRLGALRAAIATRQDSLALSLEQTTLRPQIGFTQEVPDYAVGRRRFRPYQPLMTSSFLPQAQLTDEERASIAESLAAAAERLDDLRAAQNYLGTAIELSPSARSNALQKRLNTIRAEQERRTKNAARQPVIKNVIEQDQIVHPRIPRSAP